MLSKEDTPPDVRLTVPPSPNINVSLPNIVTGGSLTGLIVMVIVTVFPSSVPSFALYENVSVEVSDPSCI